MSKGTFGLFPPYPKFPSALWELFFLYLNIGVWELEEFLECILTSEKVLLFGRPKADLNPGFFRKKRISKTLPERSGWS